MQSRPQQLSLLEAELGKALGLELTGTHNPDWLAAAVDVVRAEVPHGVEIMAEEINALVFRRIGGPKSEKAWGALTRRLLLLHIIQGTGRFRKSRGTLNHAHKYEVYVRPT